MGPNGPSLLTSISDMISLVYDPKVLGNLKEYVSLTDNVLLREINKLELQVKDLEISGLQHSKLSKLSEGGGKTRVIAIADYFTQEAFKSLFQESMRFLKSIPEDGTYDQSSARERILQAMKDNKPIHCLDLKNATDRFPRIIQEDLLSAIYGPDIAKAWGKLISEREFTDGRDRVTYAAGQPMGILSSWSVFALSHHAIIRYAASREGFSSFTDYVILGDDVSIFNTKVARRYHTFMIGLGVEISLDKSLV